MDASSSTTPPIRVDASHRVEGSLIALQRLAGKPYLLTLLEIVDVGGGLGRTSIVVPKEDVSQVETVISALPVRPKISSPPIDADGPYLALSTH